MDNGKYPPEVQEILDDPETAEEDREMFRNLVQIARNAEHLRIKLQTIFERNAQVNAILFGQGPALTDTEITDKVTELHYALHSFTNGFTVPIEKIFSESIVNDIKTTLAMWKTCVTTDCTNTDALIDEILSL